MLTRFVRTQLIIFTIASIVGVSVMLFAYMQVPTLLGVGRLTVTMELPESGGLYRFSNVTYRGVQVGKVTGVALTENGAEATLSLETSPQIPANLRAEVRSVSSGSRTLKDAINEAIRDWVTNVGDTYYLLGSVVGPHPYPLLVRDFQSIIGQETREQVLAMYHRLPDYLVACVGGGSNSIGLFHPFFNDSEVKFIGVEAGGRGLATKQRPHPKRPGRERPVFNRPI